ncbi:MAG TPA: hypothetical protein VGX26_11020 [Solirubrobacteraceae bacterium]|jgi:hypothetical protein|nr:hypothetical protein [Solirubrobacteraceae bacterium]
MSGSSGFASHRFLLALIALPLLGLSFATASASAAITETNCENLQEALNQAKAGDTITLTQMCTKSNSGVPEGKFELPKEAAFTLTGTPGAGFDGTGVSGPVLNGVVEGFTLSSLTVKNATTPAGAVTLSPGVGGVTVRSMTFTGNHSTGGAFQAGALLIKDGGCGGGAGLIEAPLTISGSTFSGNSTSSEAGVTGGGATVWAGNFKCKAIRPVSILNNTFSGNSASGSSAEQLVLGGGLAVLANNEVHDPLTQSGNFFTGNAVTGFNGATNADFGGGGEWVQGMDLTSNGDSFIANAATGSTTPTVGWTWGAGLAILNTEELCNSENRSAQSIATNLVVAGNSITAGLPADAQGAGIYTGCNAVGSGSDLTLRDSTVSGNSTVAGGVAGVDGESADHLTLTNTIDIGNTGGSDLGGFNGTGGSISSSFSDACLSGAALPGSGNICAPPLLASASDVHETSASPTIDAGSNALVPSGLTTDAFGTARILAGHTGCMGSFPAVVDMGAAEFQSAVPPCLPPRPPARGLTHFVRLKTNAKGAALTLSCTSTDGLGCSGEIFLTTDETRQGKKVIAVGARKRTKRTTVSVRIGQAPFSLPAGATATFQVKLNSTGLQLLRRFHTISAWVLANETMTNNSPVIFLLHSTLFSQAKHKHKSKHKSHHAKRRH